MNHMPVTSLYKNGRNPLKYDLTKWACLFISIAFLIGILVLLGWTFNISVLRRPIPHLVAMNALTAICFILTGAAFFLLHSGRASRSSVLAGRLIAWLIIFITGFRLAGSAFYSLPQVDQLLFKAQVQADAAAGYIDGMAVNTAISFIFSALALLLLSQPGAKKQMAAHLTALLIFLFGFFSVLGYLYQAPEFYNLLRYLPMAVHTAFGFIFIALALLLVHPREGITKEIFSALPGGVMGRLLLPAAFVIPLCLGMLRLYGYRIRFFSAEFGTTLLVLGIIVIFCGLIVNNIILLNRKEALRLNAEKRLKETEEGFRLLVNSLSDYAIMRLDKQGNILTWNSGASVIKGYDQAEIIGKHFSVLYTSTDRADKVPEYMLRMAKEQGRSEQEGWRLKKDGSLFWANVIITALYDDDGLLTGFAKVTRDMTERKKAADKFRDLLDAAPDATVIASADGTIKMINKQTERLFGYSRDQLLEKPVHYLMPEGQEEGITRQIAALLNLPLAANASHGREQLELLAQSKNSHRFPVEVSLSPIHTGDELLIAASLRDITHRKILEDNLRRSYHDLESFSYSVSHDLRAPLRGIIGFATMLEEDYAAKLDDEAKRITAVIKANTVKMTQLIDHLLRFSRLAAKDIVPQVINTNQQVKSIIKGLSTQDQKIRWHIHNLPDSFADFSAMNHVWENLLSNAVKYSRKTKQPEIEIGCSSNEDARQVFYVRDNGIGFDEKYIDKLFKVFQRLHSVGEFEGIGVGLAIVEKIVAKHQGRVWAEAKPGKGACFYFSLPAQKEAARFA